MNKGAFTEVGGEGGLPSSQHLILARPGESFVSKRDLIGRSLFSIPDMIVERDVVLLLPVAYIDCQDKYAWHAGGTIGYWLLCKPKNRTTLCPL